jgi:hypothetical protein
MLRVWVRHEQHVLADRVLNVVGVPVGDNYQRRKTMPAEIGAKVAALGRDRLRAGRRAGHSDGVPDGAARPRSPWT